MKWINSVFHLPPPLAYRPVQAGDGPMFTPLSSQRVVP
jgi:hypothetical protein